MSIIEEEVKQLREIAAFHYANAEGAKAEFIKIYVINPVCSKYLGVTLACITSGHYVYMTRRSAEKHIVPIPKDACVYYATVPSNWIKTDLLKLTIKIPDGHTSIEVFMDT